MSDRETATGVILPKWFLLCFAAFASLAIPWAGWVTTTLQTINVRFEDRNSGQERLETQLAAETAARYALEAKVAVIQAQLNKGP